MKKIIRKNNAPEHLDKTNHVEKLINFLGLKNEHVFGLHEASRKIVYHKENFSAFLEGRDEDITPVCVELVPSILCNFNCPSCTYRQNGSKYFAKEHLVNGGIMSEPTFDSIASDLARLNVKSVIITGGGEPSMNPNYLNFMKKLKQGHFDLGLYSNAGLIGKDIESILETRPRFIRLSMNAGDAKTHRTMYRTKDMFQKVVHNVINAGKIKSNMSNCETTLGVGFIMGSRNSSDSQLDSIAQTLKILASESNGGINYAAFRPEVQYFTTNLKTKKFEVCKDQPNLESFKNMFERLEERVKKPLEGSGMKILITKVGFEQLSQLYKDGKNLAAPWSISLNYDGLPHLLSEANGNPDYCFASRKDERLYDSWHSLKKKQMFANLASSPSDSNHIPILANYKLTTTSNLLKEIRETFGILTKNQVENFYRYLDLSRPIEHVNFI